jgi:uncharacterized protein YtpQ (UPF0354 family)
MKLWPFGKKEKISAAESRQPEITALDRMLAKDCSQEEFVLLFMRMLQERDPDYTIELIDDLTLRMVDSAGNESTTYLSNAWISYSRDRENRRDLLERHVRVAQILRDPDPPLIREQVIPIVKDSGYMSMFKPEDKPQCEHLCGDLWLVYAEDLPDKISSLNRERVREAGIAESEIRELARNNLRRIIPNVEHHGDGPWFLLSAGSDYTASLLLLDEIWNELAESVEGEIVATAPARDVVLYTGSQSREGLAAIREQAAHVVQTGNYVISTTLVTRVNQKWIVFKSN